MEEKTQQTLEKGLLTAFSNALSVARDNVLAAGSLIQIADEALDIDASASTRDKIEEGLINAFKIYAGKNAGGAPVVAFSQEIRKYEARKESKARGESELKSSYREPYFMTDI